MATPSCWSIPAIVTNPSLHKSLPYDIFKDLVPISIVATAPEVLVVAPQLGIKTQATLVAYGKANPGKLDYASAGVGSTPHLAAELWKARTGIDATHVPYSGIGPAFIDLMGGKVQMSFSSLPAAMPFIAKGSLVALATTGIKRSPLYPDLPTISELLPGYEVDLWLGVYGSSRMPPDVLATLNSGIDQGAARHRAEGSLRQIRHCSARRDGAGRYRVLQGRIREMAQSHPRRPYHA